MRYVTQFAASVLLCAVACSVDGESGEVLDNSLHSGAGAAMGAGVADTYKTRVAAASTLDTTMPQAKAAIEGVGKLAELVSNSPEMRGFRSVEELGAAVIEHPMPTYFVGVNALRAYEEGQDPHQLLTDRRMEMFPVTVAGEVRTAVFVDNMGGDRWKAGMWGYRKLASAAHEHRRRVMATRGLSSDRLLLVEMPSLSARFLGHDEDGQLMLTPLQDVPRTTFRAGETRQAREIVTVLQPIAMSVDTTLPN